MPKKPRGNRALSPAALVFALLVIATLAAFAWAQRVKRDPLLVDRVEYSRGGAFTPYGSCANDRVRIKFRTTTTDNGNVQIVKPGGGLVKNLARDAFLKRYRYHQYYWDGAQRGGGIAPPGRYKLRITLNGQDRVLVMPGAVKVHRLCGHGKGGGA